MGVVVGFSLSQRKLETMVREVVTIQAGQCGNQMGYAFWEAAAKEHGLSPDGSYSGDKDEQLERIEVFFDETADGKYKPTSVNFDLEPGAGRDQEKRVWRHVLARELQARGERCGKQLGQGPLHRRCAADRRGHGCHP